MTGAPPAAAGAERLRHESAGRSGAAHRILLHALNLLIAAGAFAAYQHFRIEGSTTQAAASLLLAGGFLLAPVRALLHAAFALERGVLHLVHGIGALAFVGLAGSGAISGAPVLSHAALAPFALMGAAQAVMHQNHPRNARQAQALRAFAQSLPELQQFTRAGDLSSPANAVRAVRVLSDVIAKAQLLGETELQADPGFQSALRRATARTGLTLGLDAVDQTLTKLAANPAVAREMPGLRGRLAAARRTLQ